MEHAERVGVIIYIESRKGGNQSAAISTAKELVVCFTFKENWLRTVVIAIVLLDKLLIAY